MTPPTSTLHPALAPLDREQRELLAGLHEDLHAVAATPALVTAWAMLWLDRVPTRDEQGWVPAHSCSPRRVAGPVG